MGRSRKKKYKVIVVGLPKTGTSTLAVMLRILNYTVTGPDIDYQYQDNIYLEKQFKQYDAFQDYPWCFEWSKFKNEESIKFIILMRDMESWWKSFYKSYGNLDKNYLSYPYFKIPKTSANKKKFLAYFESYYSDALDFARNNQDRTLMININQFEWRDICDFLNEDIPKNIFGREMNKPHVNKKNAENKKKWWFKMMKRIKKLLVSKLGQRKYNNLVVMLRKNGIVK